MNFIGSKLSTSKAEMQNMLAQLPSEVQAALASGALKIVDAVIYSAKRLTGSTTKELMLASDNQKEGITNLNSRKLESLNYFLIKGIRLLSAPYIDDLASLGDNVVATASYDTIDDNIANGELEILVSGKTFFPRNSCQVFKTEGKDCLNGYYELDCPRIIAPQSEIVPTLRLNEIYTQNLGEITVGDAQKEVTDLMVRIELVGCKIIPA